MTPARPAVKAAGTKLEVDHPAGAGQGQPIHFQWSWSAAALFSATLTLWAACAVLGLAYTLAIVARLDASFFESNGMIADPALREAFYLKVFDIDPRHVAILSLSLIGVSGVSYIFARSQLNYFKRIDWMLHEFARTGEVQDVGQMGSFSPYLALWMQLMQRRCKGESLKSLKPEIENVTRVWPSSPRTSWFDQLQFVAGGGALAGIFSAFCLAVFMRVNEGVVNLSNKLVRFQHVSGPAFLTEQIYLVNLVGMTLLGFMVIAFIITGYRYGRKMGEASYSILRDLRRFLEGNTDQRLFLRRNDLGREFVPSMNEALDKIASRIKD